MVEKGIDPVALKELMGHRSIRTTFSYYVFLKQEHVRKTWAECNPLSVILSRKENKQQ
jgi:Site-specific recombinase XerD